MSELGNSVLYVKCQAHTAAWTLRMESMRAREEKNRMMINVYAENWLKNLLKMRSWSFGHYKSIRISMQEKTKETKLRQKRLLRVRTSKYSLYGKKAEKKLLLLKCNDRIINTQWTKNIYHKHQWIELYVSTKNNGLNNQTPLHTKRVLNTIQRINQTNQHEFEKKTKRNRNRKIGC